MRRFFCIIALVALAACAPPQCQEAEIVVVNGCGALDLSWCHTVVQLENGSRVRLKGKWGEVGDTFTVVKHGKTLRVCDEAQ